MSQSDRAQDAPLPRRDLILLPLISIATILLLLVVAEISSRVFFPEQPIDECMATDARLGVVYRPNCHSRVKTFESEWISSSYNDCGYRGSASCAAPPKGTVRIVIMGASVALGFLVRQDQEFGEVAAHELTQKCGQHVEIQNLGGYEIFWGRVLARIPNALRLHPDAVVLQTAPYDLEREGTLERTTESEEPAGNWLVQLKTSVASSRALMVFQHYLMRNDSLYEPLYLRTGDKADYMRAPLTPYWRNQMSQYDRLLRQLSGAFQGGHVPMTLIFVPHRAQAFIAGMTVPPPGIEPRLVQKILNDDARRDGIDFVDTTKAFARAGDTSNLFYPVDGHLTATGHAIVGHALAAELLAKLPALEQCRRQTARPSAPMSAVVG